MARLKGAWNGVVRKGEGLAFNPSLSMRDRDAGRSTPIPIFPRNTR